MTQKLPQICTVILRNRIGKVACFVNIFVVTSGSPSMIDQVYMITCVLRTLANVFLIHMCQLEKQTFKRSGWQG